MTLMLPGLASIRHNRLLDPDILTPEASAQTKGMISLQDQKAILRRAMFGCLTVSLGALGVRWGFLVVLMRLGLGGSNSFGDGRQSEFGVPH